VRHYTSTQQVNKMVDKSKDKPVRQSRKTTNAAKTPESPVGAALIASLWERMSERGHTTKELAESLGITYVYLMALARGEKPIPQVGREVLKRAADYLGTPVAQAYLLAGALNPEDFVLSPTMDERIARIRDAMTHDAMWCGLALTDEVWQQTPQEARLLICMLYEQSAKTTWLDWTMVPKGTTSKVKLAS
jgi:transcriptional regulator with XRE-family HTH domain